MSDDDYCQQLFEIGCCSHHSERLLSRKPSVFFLVVRMHGERGWGKGRKNTSGKSCKVFVPSAGMLAGPIEFEHSK